MALTHGTTVPAPTVIGGAARSGRPSSPTSAARIALLQEQPRALAAAEKLLRHEAPELEVILTARTWLELVHSPAFPADLVVLDVQPHRPVSIAARIRTCRAAGAEVVVLTAADDPEQRAQALRAGAAAWVSRADPPEALAGAVRRALGASSGAAPRAWRPAPAEAVRRPRLSDGEERALRLYAEGRSVKEVASALSVRYETAKTYLRRVREKYARVGRAAGRRADLTARAVEDGYAG